MTSYPSKLHSSHRTEGSRGTWGNDPPQTILEIDSEEEYNMVE